MSKYKLCERASLGVYRDSRGWWISASEVEAFLEKAPVVSDYKVGESGLADEHGSGWVFFEASTRYKGTSHMGRLILIESIKQKTREARAIELLSSFIKSRFMDKNRNWKELDDFYHEAESLLSEDK